MRATKESVNILMEGVEVEVEFMYVPSVPDKTTGRWEDAVEGSDSELTLLSAKVGGVDILPMLTTHYQWGIKHGYSTYTSLLTIVADKAEEELLKQHNKTL